MTSYHFEIDTSCFSSAGSPGEGLSFEDRRPELLETARTFLSEHHEKVKTLHRRGAGGRKVVELLTDVADSLINQLYWHVSSDISEPGKDSCALIALGGYGRRELNPRSDIDLMFFYCGTAREFAEQISKRMLYLLWDLGLDVGYSVRTDEDCLQMAEKDITARTALLDSRFVGGELDLYKRYEKDVLRVVLEENSRQFIQEKVKENQRRLQKYGSSVYLLEPNIKEGEGGLRDLHTALWIAQVKFKVLSLRDLIIKGVLSEKEGQEFEKAQDYLWRIRNELHYLSTRKNDQLHFDQQENIARFLGYKDSKKALAVEQFMQDFYSHATKVEHMATALISKSTYQDKAAPSILGYLVRRSVEDGFYILRGELRLSQKDLFEKDPTAIMTAFELAQRHDVKLSWPLKTAIRGNLHRINDRVRRSRKMNVTFRSILKAPKRVAETLKAMHHLQFLNRFIPEFGRIFCKVQHDAYHIYTVDIHSLFAVEEITRLWQGVYAEERPLLTQVANDIEKRDLLLLAILLHDIGKGEGKDHCNKGADMMPTIARRLGLNREDSQRLEFLVRHHLKMAHISQRRDLNDDELIAEFAQSMRMSENLKMLYLLTYADIKAVGPDVWSEWKGGLLQELYEKAYDVLERGDFQLEMRSEKVRNRKKKVVEILSEEFDPKEVREALKAVSTRYLMSHRSTVIADHLRLIFSRKDRPLAISVEQDTQLKFSNVTITTFDIPGLFFKITGVMAANGINILGAQIYTQRTGIALDILQVRSSAGEIIDRPDKWERFENDLAAVVQGQVRVEDLVKKRHRPSFIPEQPRPQFANRVDINNAASSEYTVIDIYAKDKVGLLYQVTKTLKELGLYIGVAKISTKVDQVGDTFYVQDIFGQKLTLDEKIQEVRDRILQCLDEDL